MNINGPSSRLRLYAQMKSHPQRNVKKTESSADETEDIQLNPERRHQKDRRQRNIRVLLNRRRMTDRRKLRSDNQADTRQRGGRINTRA